MYWKVVRICGQGEGIKNREMLRSSYMGGPLIANRLHAKGVIPMEPAEGKIYANLAGQSTPLNKAFLK